MTDAYDPPEDEAQPLPSGLLPVLTTWMLAGGVTGLGLALTSQLIGTPAPWLMPASLLTVTALGSLAWVVDRQLAQDRPALLGTRGQLEHPPHAWLFAAPILLALPSFLLLVVVTVVAMDSAAPALVFGLGGFGAGWALRRVHARHRLNQALQHLELGELQEALETLRTLEAAWTAPRASRTSARLNLGMLALSNGEFDLASRYYEQVTDGPGVSFAKVGLALTRVLQDRLDDAEDLVLDAMSQVGSTAIQGQADAVRLLVVLRKEGAARASALGQSLENPGSGELFRGLFAYARMLEGDTAQARELADPWTTRALEEGGWRTLLPEIAELLAAPELTTA